MKTDPQPAAQRQPLVTLRDAALYITQAEHDAAEWQAATEALIFCCKA